MKLKRSDAPEMDALSPVEPATFDMGPVASPKSSGGVATLIAVLASLAAAAMVGAVAAMMYVNWELIANA